MFRSFNKKQTRFTIRVTLFWIQSLIVFSLMIWFVQQSIFLFQDTQVLEQEQDTVREQITIAQTSQRISSEESARLLLTLEQIVPSTDDYFSIILALERFSQTTGLNIARYSVNLQDQNSRFSLNVSGALSEEDIGRFLDLYQYATGRLVTIDSITISNRSQQNIEFELSIYSGLVGQEQISIFNTISQNEIDEIDRIALELANGEDLRQTQRDLLVDIVETEEAVASIEAQLENTSESTPEARF